MYDYNILVIDDDKVTLELLQVVLQDISSSEVICLSDSTQALAFVQSEKIQPISLVICDWSMPEVSGLDILAALRQSNPECPFLMVTANATKQLVIEAMRLGASDFIVKPFHTSNLLAKVEKLLRDAD